MLKWLTIKYDLKLLTFSKHQMLGVNIEMDVSFNDFFSEKSMGVS